MIRALFRSIAVLGLLSFVACGSDGSSGKPGASCDQTCGPVLAAKCSSGPVDQADCVQGCESIRSGPCASKYDALVTCAGPSPKYTCDANGQVVAAGCDAASAALYTCLSGG